MVLEDIDDKVVDVDEVSDVDIKINPDFYVHLAVSNAIKALNSDDLEKGFLKFRVLIETAESVCRGNKRLNADYDDEVENFKKLKGLGDSVEDSIRLANFKIQLIMKSIASSKFVSDSLSF